MLPTGEIVQGRKGFRVTRRQFLAGAGSAVALSFVPGVHAADGQTPLKVIGFIKPFQKLPYRQIADLAAEIGWREIECPVRKGGSIDPAAVESELPKLVEALRNNNIGVSIIATDVEDAANSLTERVLRTASELGIGRYRLKHYYYDLNKPIPPQLERFKHKVRQLAALNQDLRIQGTIQNHSGRNYVGAPVWDIWELIKDENPKFMAAYFDIGHATLEGGRSWPLQAKLMEPFLSVVSVKDFIWKNPDNESTKRKTEWKSEWCRLGNGMVSPEFFGWLKKTAFAGPICQHFEYEMGSGKKMIETMKKDLGVLQQWLTTAPPPETKARHTN